MLGKLIKHEFKDTYRMAVLLLALIFIMTLVGVVGIIAPLKMLISNGHVMTKNTMAGMAWILTIVLSIMLYMITMLGVTYGILIYMGVRFYRSMYADEGYLTQTLPVTPRQLLFSKVFVAGTWYLAVNAALVVSILALVYVLVGSVAGAGSFGGVHVDEIFRSAFGSLPGVMRDEFGVSAFRFLFSLLFLLLTGPYAGMMILFGCISVGQLSGKHKAMMGILAYFGVMIAQAILGSFLRLFFTFGFSDMPNIMGTYDSNSLVALLVAVGMYFAAHGVLSKKLNMD